jgi:hypothetical protein
MHTYTAHRVAGRDHRQSYSDHGTFVYIKCVPWGSLRTQVSPRSSLNRAEIKSKLKWRGFRCQISVIRSQRIKEMTHPHSQNWSSTWFVIVDLTFKLCHSLHLPVPCWLLRALLCCLRQAPLVDRKALTHVYCSNPPLCVSSNTLLVWHAHKGRTSKALIKRVSLEKRHKNAQYRHLLKAPDLNSGTKRSEVFGCVSSQDEVGS